MQSTPRSARSRASAVPVTPPPMISTWVCMNIGVFNPASLRAHGRSRLRPLLQGLPQIAHAGIDRSEFSGIGLGHIDPEFLVQGDQEVEEIHGIDVELIAQALRLLETARVQFGN